MWNFRHRRSYGRNERIRDCPRRIRSRKESIDSATGWNPDWDTFCVPESSRIMLCIYIHVSLTLFQISQSIHQDVAEHRFPLIPACEIVLTSQVTCHGVALRYRLAVYFQNWQHPVRHRWEQEKAIDWRSCLSSRLPMKGRETEQICLRSRGID